MPDIVIIGAGAAGVGAARRLHQAGLDVVIIEAATRVGGRAHTVQTGGMALDLGCGWLHSAERNPWTRIAEERGIAVDRSRSAWRQQYRDLGFSPAEQAEAEAAWHAWNDRMESDHIASDRAHDALPPGGAWNAYIEAISGYLNGTTTAGLSIADYLAYDHAASEINWRLPDGYGALVARCLPPVTLHLATAARAVDHRGRMVLVRTDDGTLACRACIVTVSTNLLAAGEIRFAAELDDHLHAAADLPLGLADKVFLRIEGSGPFEPETHLIGNPRSGGTGGYYVRPFGRSVIECFYGGAGAEDLSKAGLDGAFAFAIDELAGLFGGNVRRWLRGLVGSDWARESFVRGGYSHARGPGGAARGRRWPRRSMDGFSSPARRRIPRISPPPMAPTRVACGRPRRLSMRCAVFAPRR